MDLTSLKSTMKGCFQTFISILSIAGILLGEQLKRVWHSEIVKTSVVSLKRCDLKGSLVTIWGRVTHWCASKVSLSTVLSSLTTGLERLKIKHLLFEGAVVTCNLVSQMFRWLTLALGSPPAMVRFQRRFQAQFASLFSDFVNQKTLVDAV